MKKVLMIAFHYPPDNSSGMLRALKFSKYLPKYDWMPYILTSTEEVYDVRDEEMIRDKPPCVKVFRARSFDAKKYLSIDGKYPSFLSIPDRYWSWMPFAVSKGMSIIKNYDIDVLYSTSPIPTAHLIALILKKISQLPWISDFRDPWVDEKLRPELSRWRYKLEALLEKKVIEHSNRVIANTDSMNGSLITKFPDSPTEKFTVIHNGYDESDFMGIEVGRGKTASAMEIVHTGIIYEAFRDPKPLLQAISSLIREGRIPKQNIILKFIGGGEYLESHRCLSTLESLKMNENIQIIERVPHRECLKYLFESDVLLLLQYTEAVETQIPAKVFEYIRTGKPILALVSEGATSDLIRKHDLGITVDYRDIDAIKEAVMTLHDRHKNNKPPETFDSRELYQFSREHLTGKLVDVLDEITNSK